jgi:hypothetical protein
MLLWSGLALPTLHARGLGDADGGDKGDPERVGHLLEVADGGAHD